MLLNSIQIGREGEAKVVPSTFEFLLVIKKLVDGEELGKALEAIAAWPKFPLRSLAPDVLEFLVSEGRFSVRERKAIIAEMGEDIDPFEPVSFYEAYLDRVEAKPYAACFFEQLLFSALSPNKVRRKLEKKPVGAMRLASRPALKKQLTNILENELSPLPVEIVLAVFYESAILSFQDLKDTKSGSEFLSERQSCFLGDANASQVNCQPDEGRADLASVGDDAAVLNDVDALLARVPFDADAFDDAVTLLYQMLEALEPEASSEIFDRFAMLASQLPVLAKAASEDPEPDALARRLEDVCGLSVQEVSAWIRLSGAKVIVTELLSALDTQKDAIAVSQQLSAEAKGLASELLAKDDFAGAHLALATATREKAKFDRLESLRSKVVEELINTVSNAGGNDELWSAITELVDKAADNTPNIIEGGSADEIEAGEDSGQSNDDVQPCVGSRSPTPEIKEHKGLIQHKKSEPVIEQMPPVAALEGKQNDGAAADVFANRTTIREIEPEEERSEIVSQAAPENLVDPLYSNLIADLVEANCLNVAAEITPSLNPSPIDGRVLRAAALARSPNVGFTPAAQRLGASLSEVITEELNSTSSALLFAGALHVAIFVPSAFPRTPLSEINFGTFGPALNDLRNFVVEMDYQFPPAGDVLARLVGKPVELKRTQILRELEEWASEISQRTGPCQPSTKFMHRVASSRGGIGAAIEAIKSGTPDADAVVQQAIDRYGSYDSVDESLADENAALGSRSAVRLPRATIDYLVRRLGIATDLLSSWQISRIPPAKYDPRHDENVKRTAETLRSHLRKASDGLRDFSREQDSKLDAAVALWISARIADVETSLSGRDVLTSPIGEIELGELDRLTPAMRSALISGNSSEVFKILCDAGVPSTEEAIEANRAAAAFATAGRLSGNGMALLREQLEFATSQLKKTRDLSRRVITLSKLDLRQQEHYPALALTLEGSTSAFLEAEDAAAGGIQGLRDLDKWLRSVKMAEKFVEHAEISVREGQEARVRELINSVNSEDATTILQKIAEGMTLEATENRIALLRDGRSIGFLDGSDDGPMGAFSPTFVDAAVADAWPSSVEEYARSFSSDGILATEPDRREPAVELMRLMSEIQRSVAANSPAVTKVRKLFEDLGFLNPTLDEMSRVQSAKAWTFALRAEVRTEPDNWFLPPVFGSRAKGRYRLVMADSSVLPETLVPTLDQDEPAFIVITSRLDAGRRRELASRLRGAGQPAVLIDETLLAFVATRRETRLEVIFACGLPYGRVEPYLTDATVLPPEMFFGREDEIRTIMRRSSDGCLVYGGRQLGKSALLSHVESTRHNPSEGQIVVRDQVTDLGLPNDPAKNIWARLHAKLSLTPGIVRQESRRDRDQIADNIKLWLSQDTRRRIIALFDETDEFMSAESTTGFREITKLKDLMESTDRAFKVVFAGLHNVQRLHNVSNSPLAHLGEPIVIGPLNRTLEDKRAAHELVVAPMRSAGFRYETEETPDKILAFANDYPSLVQEYSKGLLSQLHRTGSGRGYTVGSDGPLWTIPDATLFDHENFGRIQENIRKKFRWTLDLDVRYALIAYTLALLSAEGREREVLHDGLSPRDILEEATPHWPHTSEMLDAAAFEVILDEMWDLGILGRRLIPNTNRHLYCLRSPQVAAVLGSWDDAVDELGKIKDREGKPNYDKATYRRSVTPKNSRRLYMPLTDLQVERLLEQGAPGVKIVCGLKLLGLDKVGKAFVRIQEEMGLPGPVAGASIQIEQTGTTKEFRRLLDAPVSRGVDMVVVVHEGSDPEETGRLVEFAERHSNVIGGGVRPVFPVDASHQSMRHLAARRKESSAHVAPWGVEMLRMHMRQIEGPATLDTREVRQMILDATGGVPDQVILAVENLINADDRSSAIEALRDKFGPSNSLIDKKMLSYLAPLTATDSLEFYAMLDEDVRGRFGLDLESIVPDLQAMGLVERWVPKRGIFAPSALGDLLRERIQEEARSN
jgi:hypothetical protein